MITDPGKFISTIPLGSAQAAPKPISVPSNPPFLNPLKKERRTDCSYSNACGYRPGASKALVHLPCQKDEIIWIGKRDRLLAGGRNETVDRTCKHVRGCARRECGKGNGSLNVQAKWSN